MAWAAIIAALISVFGPILLDWLKKWLGSHLHTAAALLPAPDTYADEPAAREALFAKAAELTRNPLKRLLLRRIARHARVLDVRAGDTSYPPPEAVAEELRDIAGMMDEEGLGGAGAGSESELGWAGKDDGE